MRKLFFVFVSVVVEGMCKSLFFDKDETASLQAPFFKAHLVSEERSRNQMYFDY